MTSIGLTVLGFFLGSIPFSVWLGQLALQTDIRRYGIDQNPGAANAWRAGKWRVGLPVLVLDFFKGAIPVGLASFVFDISGWTLIPIGLAPVLGHAFSPFLGFKGGKAITVTFGIWTGLILAKGPIALGLFLAFFYFVFASTAWSLILGMLGFLVFLLLDNSASNLLMIWLGNMLILTWKQMDDLREQGLPKPKWFKTKIGKS